MALPFQEQHGRAMFLPCLAHLITQSNVRREHVATDARIQLRSREDGKASAVQFVRFSFTPSQIAAFRSGSGDVVVGFDHPNYGHMAVMPQAVRDVLGRDFA